MTLSNASTKSNRAPQRRASAVSQVLQTLSRPQDGWPLPGEMPEAFQLHVAHSRMLREKAYRLAYQVYLTSGYTPERKNRLCLNKFDVLPHTFTILICSGLGEPAGTVSLVFDSDSGLPSDEIFSSSLQPLRVQQRKLVEVTRLAIAPAFAQSRMLLVRLFNLVYIYARRCRAAQDFVIEVNPRHVNAYRKLMGFEFLSEDSMERPCPRVQGAPARLMHLDLGFGDRVIAEARTSGPQFDPSNRRLLYPKFLDEEREFEAAEFMNHAYRPMSAEEAAYFGLPACSRDLEYGT